MNAASPQTQPDAKKLQKTRPPRSRPKPPVSSLKWCAPTGFHTGALRAAQVPLVAAVDKSGKVQQITMVQRSDNEQFDPSARNAVIRTTGKVVLRRLPLVRIVRWIVSSLWTQIRDVHFNIQAILCLQGVTMPSAQRTTLLFFSRRLFQLLGILTLSLTATGAWAAAMATADTSGGYAGKMLDKVVDIWAPPPALKGDFQVQLKVGLDGKGHVLNCTPVRPSGMEALDSSACGAVRQIGSFGRTPYEKPLEVHLSFWTGTPKGKTRNQIPDDAESLRLEEQARVKAEAAMSDNMAAGAEERARQRAEEAAKATGKDLPAIRPTVVAPAPPARDISAGKTVKADEKATPVAGRSPDSTQAKVSLGNSRMKNDQDKAQGKDTAGAAISAPSAQVQAPPLTVAPTPLPTVSDAGAQPPATGDVAVPVGRSVAPTPAASAPASDAKRLYGPKLKAQYKYGKNYSTYFVTVKQQLAKSIIIPVETPPGTYYPTVRLKVNPKTGAIEDAALIEKSGNKMLDSFVRKGIGEVGHILPPPEGLDATLDITLTLVRR